jgi:hypothetical protein
MVKSADPPKPAPPVAIEALPVLTDPLVTLPAAPRPLSPLPPVATVQAQRRLKVKVPKPPRVQIRTEDVYAMIEEALSRIAASTPRQSPEVSVRGGSGLSQSRTPSDSRAGTRGQDLENAIERMEQRLRTAQHSKT